MRERSRPARDCVDMERLRLMMAAAERWDLRRKKMTPAKRRTLRRKEPMKAATHVCCRTYSHGSALIS